jgi:CheY-like chemotaxis protein
MSSFPAVTDKPGASDAGYLESRVLAAKKTVDSESMQFRFSEGRKLDQENMKELLQNMRIGAVDDDFIIQELIRNAFGKTGASVKTYSDGSEFLADPESKYLDLVFLDLLMPNINGFEVLQRLQTWTERPAVIILSAMSKRDAVIQAFQMGVKSYLVKPLKPEDIFKKSLEVLKMDF